MGSVPCWSPCSACLLMSASPTSKPSGFALAGLDQRRDRAVDVVVGVLGPSRHVRRLLLAFAFVDLKVREFAKTAAGGGKPQIPVVPRRFGRRESPHLPIARD